MFCTSCGREVKNNTKFCTGCGKELMRPNRKEAAKKFEGVNSQETEIREQQQEQKKAIKIKIPEKKAEPIKEQVNISEKKKSVGGNGKVIGIVIALIIFIGGAVGMGWYLFGDEVMFMKYKRDLKSIMNIQEKMPVYDKVVAVGKLGEVKEELIKDIENGDRDLKLYDELKNLSRKEREALKRDTYIYIAELEEKAGNYIEAKEALDNASVFDGYNPQNDEMYRKIEKQLNEENASYNNDEYYDSYSDSNAKVKDITKNKGYMDDSGYIIPDSDSRYLSRGEILSYGRDKIDYLINEIYARRGYVFKEQPYVNYFNSKSWYIPRYGSQDDARAYFNDYEIENVETMVRIRDN